MLYLGLPSLYCGWYCPGPGAKLVLVGSNAPALELIEYFGPFGKEYGIVYCPGPGVSLERVTPRVAVPIFHFGFECLFIEGAY